MYHYIGHVNYGLYGLFIFTRTMDEYRLTVYIAAFLPRQLVANDAQGLIGSLPDYQSEDSSCV